MVSPSTSYPHDLHFLIDEPVQVAPAAATMPNAYPTQPNVASQIETNPVELERQIFSHGKPLHMFLFSLINISLIGLTAAEAITAKSNNNNMIEASLVAALKGTLLIETGVNLINFIHIAKGHSDIICPIGRRNTIRTINKITFAVGAGIGILGAIFNPSKYSLSNYLLVASSFNHLFNGFIPVEKTTQVLEKVALATKSCFKRIFGCN